MWNAKCFVKVKVANICSNETGACQSNLSIHVSPIHVDLPSVIMNNPANLINSFFIDSMS
uniref:AtGLDP2 (Arabidopsis thaliana glycine decarboxylase P-protein 2) n=1 Tax=Arundo donax TaxID=35708 RepID=A0A0A9GSC6_ARUDO